MSEAMDLHDERREGAPAGSTRPEHELEGGGALREQLESADRWTRDFVREHPVASVAAAALAGFVLGRIAARYL